MRATTTKDRPTPRRDIAAGKGRTGDVCEVECLHPERVDRVRAQLKPADRVAALAETFRVLGDPTRISIVWALSTEELCVCDLAHLLGMSQSAVSHSLRALRQLRLVRFRKVGKIAYYSLDDDHIVRILAEGIRHVEETA